MQIAASVACFFELSGADRWKLIRCSLILVEIVVMLRLLFTPRAAFLAAILVCIHATPGVHAGEKKMNLICIVTDDQGHWSLGTYGNKESKTPNMDRIGREGAVFKNAFTATPVCSPSRATFLTGKYGSQVKITDWINPTEGKEGVGLAVNAVTWMRVLQAAGYRTGLVGKWHLGELAYNHPTKRGFDFFMGFLGGGNKPIDPTLGPHPPVAPHSPVQQKPSRRIVRFDQGPRRVDQPLRLARAPRDPRPVAGPPRRVDARNRRPGLEEKVT
jgi:arylsulfatase A-like enzyme